MTKQCKNHLSSFYKASEEGTHSVIEGATTIVHEGSEISSLSSDDASSETQKHRKKKRKAKHRELKRVNKRYASDIWCSLLTTTLAGKGMQRKRGTMKSIINNKGIVLESAAANDHASIGFRTLIP